MIISAKKLIKMARKWQKLSAMRRKRISLPSSLSSSSPVMADKGHFVAYTADKARFALPLKYLKSYILRELLRMSEEEFGLPTNGPITLPCDGAFMDYLVSLIQRGATEEIIEKALLTSMAAANSSRCSMSCSFLQEKSSQQLLVCGF